MGVRIRWSPSTDEGTANYKIEKSAATTGPWTLAAQVTHDLTGADFNSTLGLFDWLDEDGTVSTWYRIITVNDQLIESQPTPPFRSFALVSPPMADVDEFKEYLGIEHENDDPLIAKLIEATSAFVESYTGQVFRYRLKTETRDGNGDKSLSLRESPVVDVVTVTLDDQAVPESTNTQTQGWFLQDSVLRLRGYRFNHGDGNVQVSYTCGYPVIPADLRQVVIELAGLKYRDRTRLGKATESLSGQSVSYLPSLIPAAAQAVLDAYRRQLA